MSRRRWVSPELLDEGSRVHRRLDLNDPARGQPKENHHPHIDGLAGRRPRSPATVVEDTQMRPRHTGVRCHQVFLGDELIYVVAQIGQAYCATVKGGPSTRRALYAPPGTRYPTHRSRRRPPDHLCSKPRQNADARPLCSLSLTWCTFQMVEPATTTDCKSAAGVVGMVNHLLPVGFSGSRISVEPLMGTFASGMTPLPAVAMSWASPRLPLAHQSIEDLLDRIGSSADSARQSTPGSASSAPKCARPVSFSTSSKRRTDVPTDVALAQVSWRDYPSQTVG